MQNAVSPNSLLDKLSNEKINKHKLYQNDHLSFQFCKIKVENLSPQ